MRFISSLTTTLVAMSFFAFAAQASAQTSWLPAYDDSASHVYVAPDVDAAVAEKFLGKDVQEELVKAAALHNLDVYVVVTRSGLDAGSDVKQRGPVQVRKLWSVWSGDSGFKTERALVILITGDGTSFNSVGVRAGDYLNRLGIVRDTMSSPTGPVRPAAAAHIATEPEMLPAKIVANINKIVDSKLNGKRASTGSNKTSASSKKPSLETPVWNWLIILAIVVVALFALKNGVIWLSSSDHSSYDHQSDCESASGFQRRMDEWRRSQAATTNGNNGGNSSSEQLKAAQAAAAAGGLLSPRILQKEEERRKPATKSSSSSSRRRKSNSSSTDSSTSSASCTSSSSSSSSCGGGGCGGGGCGGG